MQFAITSPNIFPVFTKIYMYIQRPYYRDPSEKGKR